MPIFSDEVMYFFLFVIFGSLIIVSFVQAIKFYNKKASGYALLATLVVTISYNVSFPTAIKFDYSVFYYVYGIFDYVTVLLLLSTGILARRVSKALYIVCAILGYNGTMYFIVGYVFVNYQLEFLWFINFYLISVTIVDFVLIGVLLNFDRINHEKFASQLIEKKAA